MSRLVYLSRQYRDCRTAGNKAKSDYEDILSRAGAVNLGLPRTYAPGKVSGFLNNLTSVMNCCMRLRRGDVLVLQYPVKKYFTVLCRCAHRRGATVVALIHDLGSWRRRKLTVAEELRRLECADVVVATNPAMLEWLDRHGLSGVRTQALGLHDFLSPAKPWEGPLPGLENIAYAGSLNMRKNAFLPEMSKIAGNLKIHLYGTMSDYDPSRGNTGHIVEHGFISADDFIAHAGSDSAWGLVWDGPSTQSCQGPWGGYLAVNTPHKSAFYLRAGLPLIVWSESAIAPIVRRRELGLCVDSLDNLAATIAAVTPARYAQMRGNALRAGNEAAEGRNLLNVLEKLGMIDG